VRLIDYLPLHPLDVQRTVAALLATAALCAGAGAAPVSASASPESTAAADRSVALAAVFKRTPEGRVYCGTVTDAGLLGAVFASSPAAAASTPTEPPMGATHEVWVLSSDTTAGFWYSAGERTVGTLKTGGAAPGAPAAADLQRLIDAAAPARPEPAPRAEDTLLGFAATLTPPGTLRALVSGAQVIVVGRVIGVVRTVPPSAKSGFGMPYTVYAVAVEGYLNHDGYTPPVLRVWQMGGWRPLEGNQPVYSVCQEDPMLTVGERYCLFLRLPEARVRARRQALRNAEEVAAPEAALDEYFAAHPWRGKLLLRGGLTRAPAVSRHRQENHWQFESGPQVLDIHEERAFALTAEAVVQVAEDRERQAGGLAQVNPGQERLRREGNEQVAGSPPGAPPYDARHCLLRRSVGVDARSASRGVDVEVGVARGCLRPSAFSAHALGGPSYASVVEIRRPLPSCLARSP
jgi:hypothetical protein